MAYSRYMKGRIAATTPTLVRCAEPDNEVMQQATDLCRRHGGIMRIRRSVIIPAIIALSAAGSILAGSTAPVVSAHGTTTHVVAMAPRTWVHA